METEDFPDFSESSHNKGGSSGSDRDMVDPDSREALALERKERESLVTKVPFEKAVLVEELESTEQGPVARRTRYSAIPKLATTPTKGSKRAVKKKSTPRPQREEEEEEIAECASYVNHG